MVFLTWAIDKAFKLIVKLFEEFILKIDYDQSKVI